MEEQKLEIEFTADVPEMDMVEISFDEDDEGYTTADEAREHFENIVDAVDKQKLRALAQQLVIDIDKDREERRPQDEKYAEALRLTGLGEPAPGGLGIDGGSTVTHPIMVQSCVDFSSRVMREIFPANGPVKSKILGEQDHEKIKKAQRVAELMRWQTTEQMSEFRPLLGQALTQVGLIGVHYVKMYWSDRFKRPVVEDVPLDYVFTPITTSTFDSAERITHVLRLTDRDIKERYGVDVSVASNFDEVTETQLEIDKIEGADRSSFTEDGLKELYEVSCYLDIEGDDAPYLITIDPSSLKVLSLYRNWKPDDALKVRLDWIVELPCLPWRGAYPVGLVHFIGDLARCATGSLRALLDSAAIQNIPSFLTLKGGPTGQSIDIRPGQSTQIDAGAVTDDIKKYAMPLPFPGPSPVLANLLDYVVKQAKETVDVGLDRVADGNPNAPVGTTLALIEQGAVVFSEIHHRMHHAMGRLLGILYRINHFWVDEEVLELWNTGLDVKPEDFDGPVDVIPVSEPHIFSEAQRFAQVQALMQRAAATPALYDQRKVEERFLEQLKIPAGDVLQPMPGSEDLDPVSENVAATMGRPFVALPKQDHIGHIKVHMAFVKSPVLMSPSVRPIALPAIVQNILQHISQLYLTQAHEAVVKADELMEGVVIDDTDAQTMLILNTQAQIEQALAPIMPEVQALVQEAEQYKQQPGVQNPMLEIEQLKGQMRLELEKFKQEAENQRATIEMQMREKMNSDDNQTAMRLAIAESMTGDRYAVSTGGGINPGV